MKKSSILRLVILLLVGLLISACQNNENGSLVSRGVTENEKEVIAGDFSLTVTLDKTEARIRDTITVTVVFKNLSDIDIEAELPDWIAAGGGRNKEDILDAVLLYEGVEWGFLDILFKPRPKILIENGAVIERQFEFTVTEKKNFEVHAGAFFITQSTVYPEGMQTVSTSLKIKVQ